MARNIYQWELYCTTESAYKTTWNEIEPTVCPTNSSHTISTNPGPRIIDMISSNSVKIEEETGGVTQGLYRSLGFQKDIPSGNVGNVTTITHSWPYPISILSSWFMAKSDQLNDQFTVSVGDSTVIGAIAAPVYTGNTIMTVTSTVFDYVYKGYKIDITDGVNLNQMGEVVSIDKLNGNITMEIPAVNTFSPLSPTYVRLTVPVISSIHINEPNQKYSFADKKIGGKFLPANAIMRIKYTNNEGNAKVFSYVMEMLY